MTSPIRTDIPLHADQYRAYVRDTSPRWLLIIRDTLLSVAALLFILGAIYTAVALNRASNALDDLGNSLDPSPSSSSTVDVSEIPGTAEFCALHPDNPSC